MHANDAHASHLDFGEGNFSGKTPIMWTIIVLMLIGLVPYIGMSYVYIYSHWISLIWEETESSGVTHEK